MYFRINVISGTVSIDRGNALTDAFDEAGLFGSELDGFGNVGKCNVGCLGSYVGNHNPSVRTYGCFG